MKALPTRSTGAPARSKGAPAQRPWTRYYRLRPFLLGVLAAVVLAVLLCWPQITDFYSFNAGFYVSIVGLAAVTAILTISLNLCMGYGGMLSLMHTGLQLVGGYAVAVTSVRAGLSPWLGVLIAIVAGALVAAAVIAISLRATYLYFGMITLAANLILIEVGREWESVTGGIVGISGVPLPSIGRTQLDRTTFYYVVLVMLALAYVVQRNIVKSGLGRATMAIRESSDTASALGIRPNTTKLLIFAISGGLGGLAGALYALQLSFINPDVGLLDNGLIFFVGLLLGGIGTLMGPLLGVGVVTYLDFSIREAAQYRTLILGIILLGAMMIIPRGIVGTWKASRLGRDLISGDDAPPLTEVPETVARVEPAEPGVAALEGTGIVKHFGGVKALDGVDIRIEPHTIHGIIGPNGSGKSTLVSCLTRYHPLTGGEVRVYGTPAPKAPYAVARAGVTRVFQVPHLFERVSVLDNVLTGMRLRERYTWLGAVLRSPAYRRQDRAERAEARELLAFAGLAGRAEWPASSLSHGQKRLLEVVRAVATRPKVLILDEPATGLTRGEIESLGRLIRVLRDRGLSIVLIEHNVDFVMGVCDTLTVLDGGRMIAEGPPEQVRGDARVLEAYLGRADLVEDAS